RRSPSRRGRRRARSAPSPRRADARTPRRSSAPAPRRRQESKKGHDKSWICSRAPAPAPYHGLRRNGGAWSARLPCSDARGAAVSARIVRALERAVGMKHDRAGMADEVGVGFRQKLDLVAGREQAVDQIAVEAGFQAQAGAERAPGAAEEPAGRVDGALERLAIAHVAGEERSLGLRLAIAAHAAVGEDAAVGELGERRVEGGERPPAGLEGNWPGGSEAGACRSVLPQAGERRE